MSKAHPDEAQDKKLIDRELAKKLKGRKLGSKR